MMHQKAELPRDVVATLPAVRSTFITRVQAFVAAGGALMGAGVISWLSSNLIASWFPDRPTPRDLLMESLPYVEVGQYVTDIAVGSALLIILVELLRDGARRLPLGLAIYAAFYALRAVTMLLTPLASAHGNGVFYGFVHMTQNGMFPSGHVGAVLLAALLVNREARPRLRTLLFAMAAVEAAALVVSHGHYSIDVVGGLLLAYFVWREGVYGETCAPLRRWLLGEGEGPGSR